LSHFLFTILYQPGGATGDASKNPHTGRFVNHNNQCMVPYPAGLSSA
jgi:hypothetical protein